MITKQVPLMFTREMMIANLAGRKTQTRRPLKIKNLEFLAPHGEDENDPSNWGYLNECGEGVTLDTMLPAQPGDILCARETMRVIETEHAYDRHTNELNGTRIKLRYEADGYETDYLTWPDRLEEKPVHGKCLSNGGPREFWRFQRPLTSVRIERIQSISEADAIAEGLNRVSKDGQLYKFGICDRDGLPGNDDIGWHWKEFEVDPRDALRKLWNATYSGSWERNDWIVVYEYARRAVTP